MDVSLAVLSGQGPLSTAYESRDCSNGHGYGETSPYHGQAARTPQEQDDDCGHTGVSRLLWQLLARTARAGADGHAVL
jgi:hypothetical protein